MIAIPDSFAAELPHGRALTQLEAYFLLHVELEAGALLSLSECARRWRWSRTKVRAAVVKWGLIIEAGKPTRIKTIKEQSKPQENKELKEPKNGKKTAARPTKPAPEISDELFPDLEAKTPPTFSPKFIIGPWLRWCQTKKGGNYPNEKSRQRMLQKLYEMSRGDEELAERALEEAFAKNYMTFIYSNFDTPYYETPASNHSSGCANPHAARNAERLRQLALDGNPSARRDA